MSPRHRYTALRVIACIFTSLIVTTSCSDDHSDGKKDAGPTKSIPVIQACEGIFDKEITEEARYPKGPSRVPPTTKDGIERAANSLSKVTARHSVQQDTCTLVSHASNLTDWLSIKVQWGTKQPPAGKTVHYTPASAGWENATLLVTCDLGTVQDEINNSRALALIVEDHLTVSDHSRAKLLISTAKKLASRLGCENDITYPDPMVIAPPPDPGLR